MPSTPSTPTSSGITTTSDGDRHIPASVRPDGSTRKEIKIRPGYRPPEDVEVYKSRTAEAWKYKGLRGGVPGAEAVEKEEIPKTAGGDRNARRREAKRRAKAVEEEKAKANSLDEPAENNGPVEEQANGVEQGKDADKGKDQTFDPMVEKEKQARNLKKKLRQARELRERKDQGQNLLPEQFEKVIKINELIRQLNSLGFDAEMEPKG